MFFGLDIYAYLGTDIVSLAIFALVFGFGGAFISLLSSKWIAKRVYRMQHISSHTSDLKLAIIYDTVSMIAKKNSIQMPEVCYYQSSEPNAFATGPSKNNSLVAVSSALLEQMTEKEIRGVVWHEMAHVINGDMVTMTLLQGIINTFVIFLARVLAFAISNAMRSDNRNWLGGMWYFLVVSILDMTLWSIGLLVLSAYSRHREFAADAGSAAFVGKDDMIAALQKLQHITVGMKVAKDELASLKIAWWEQVSLFATHPPLSLRIRRLQNM